MCDVVIKIYTFLKLFKKCLNLTTESIVTKHDGLIFDTHNAILKLFNNF